MHPGMFKYKIPLHPTSNQSTHQLLLQIANTLVVPSNCDGGTYCKITSTERSALSARDGRVCRDCGAILLVAELVEVARSQGGVTTICASTTPNPLLLWFAISLPVSSTLVLSQYPGGGQGDGSKLCDTTRSVERALMIDFLVCESLAGWLAGRWWRRVYILLLRTCGGKTWWWWT